MRIKAIIEQIIALREGPGIQVCLLAVCPNSAAVLEAAVRAAARHNTPMLFAATLNQVDRDGGYTGWTPQLFVDEMLAYAARYDADPSTLYPCLDHGGPWLKDVHTRDKLTYEQTNAEIKQSITAMLEAGYQLLHIDPTVDRTFDGPPPVELIVQRSLDLIAHAEAERIRLNLPPISYEVGTEEVHGGLVDVDSFTTFLDQLYTGLDDLGLSDALPAFVVAQVGTNLHTTYFDRVAADRLYPLVSAHNALVKGHYSDSVSNPKDYSAAGMGGANVGPEFTAVEYHALQALVRRETNPTQTQLNSAPSEFFMHLTTAVDKSNRWQKWLQPDEQGKALADLTPDRLEWMLNTCARYVWTEEDVVASRARLYDNLRTDEFDPHQYVVDQITAVIEHYIEAFNLVDANELFQL